MTSESDNLISPMFGEIAVQLGFCRPEHIEDALGLQEKQRFLGREADRIGAVLEKRGRLNSVQVRRVLKEVEARTRTIEVEGYRALRMTRRGRWTLTFAGETVDGRHPVTLRLLRFGLTEDSRHRDRFLLEGRAAAGLDHPNLVKQIGTGALEGVPYQAFRGELGTELGRTIDDHGPLLEKRALEILGTVAATLGYAHDQGVLHAALGPRKILVSRCSGPRLIGFCCRLDGYRDAQRRGMIDDPPLYQAPEILTGGANPTPACDVYSLGAALFHMLTGRPPFRGTSREILRQHLARPIPDPRIFAAGVSEAAASLVAHFLEKSPRRRPLDMVMARADIAAAAASLGRRREEGRGRPHTRLMSCRPGRLRR